MKEEASTMNPLPRGRLIFTDESGAEESAIVGDKPEGADFMFAEVEGPRVRLPGKWVLNTYTDGSQELVNTEAGE